MVSPCSTMSGASAGRLECQGVMRMPGAGVIWKRLTYRCDPKSGLSWDCQPKTLTVCWGAWTCNVVGSEREHAGTDCLENEIPRWEAAGPFIT